MKIKGTKCVFFQRDGRNEKVGPLNIETVILTQQNGSVQSHNTPLSTRPQRSVKAERRKKISYRMSYVKILH